MNKEVKAKWIAALRSGNYEQGEGRLHIVGRNDNPDTYCCLGVLCELAVAENIVDKPVIVKDSRHHDGEWSDCFMYDDVQIAGLPTPVLKWAGIHNATLGPAVNIHGRTVTLSSHNDSGATFEQIASAIDEQL